MMRIRTVKPEFFLHEGIFDAEMETGLPLRLAFAGLWCAADREGRFEWKPRRLKVQIMPYDDVDFSRVLDALATRGFLARFVCPDGREIGFVPSFPDHQMINNRERPSELPDPLDCVEYEYDTTRALRVADACSTELQLCQGEGKGKEGKGREQGREGSTSISGAEIDTASARSRSEPVPYAKVYDLFAELCPSLGQPRIRDDNSRKARIRSLWGQARSFAAKKQGGEDIAWRYVEVLFSSAEGSAFLRGEKPSEGHSKWKANFDWVVKPANITKILEGAYEQ